jgi:hypothetical protein
MRLDLRGNDVSVNDPVRLRCELIEVAGFDERPALGLQ